VTTLGVAYPSDPHPYEGPRDLMVQSAYELIDMSLSDLERRIAALDYAISEGHLHRIYRKMEALRRELTSVEKDLHKVWRFLTKLHDLVEGVPR
jgi:hypothetical protein